MKSADGRGERLEERRQQRELQRAEHSHRDPRIWQDGVARVADERHAEAEDIQAAPRARSGSPASRCVCGADEAAARPRATATLGPVD